MRIWWILLVVLVAVSFSGAHAQLSVGPGGLTTPAINLISVFKFLRDIWIAYMYPTPTAEPQTKTEDVELITVEAKEEKEEEGEVNRISETLQERVSVMGYDTNGNIVEKFDSGCLDDGTGECITYESDDQYSQEPPLNRNEGVTSEGVIEGVIEDKTATSQLVVGKWPILYISLISVLFWIIVIVATPYVLTGETYGRREDDFSPNSIIDQQDVLLLLSFLLGEVSEDASCLERIVCLTPTKSSRYISVSSMIFNVASYFRRWMPYSARFEDMLQRLEDVTLDGFSQDCQNYFCKTIPEL